MTTDAQLETTKLTPSPKFPVEENLIRPFSAVCQTNGYPELFNHQQGHKEQTLSYLLLTSQSLAWLGKTGYQRSLSYLLHLEEEEETMSLLHFWPVSSQTGSSAHYSGDGGTIYRFAKWESGLSRTQPAGSWLLTVSLQPVGAGWGLSNSSLWTQHWTGTCFLAARPAGRLHQRASHLAATLRRSSLRQRASHPTGSSTHQRSSSSQLPRPVLLLGVVIPATPQRSSSRGPSRCNTLQKESPRPGWSMPERPVKPSQKLPVCGDFMRADVMLTRRMNRSEH